MTHEELAREQALKERCSASGRHALAVFTDDQILAMARTAHAVCAISPTVETKTIYLCAASFLADELLRRKEDRHNAEFPT